MRGFIVIIALLLLPDRILRHRLSCEGKERKGELVGDDADDDDDRDVAEKLKVCFYCNRKRPNFTKIQKGMYAWHHWCLYYVAFFCCCTITVPS